MWAGAKKEWRLFKSDQMVKPAIYSQWLAESDGANSKVRFLLIPFEGSRYSVLHEHRTNVHIHALVDMNHKMKYLSVAGDPLTILLDGKETDGVYTVMEAILPIGGGPPPHVHSREDEGFLVMTGEVTFYLGDKTILLKSGEYLLAPRGIPHHFRNTGSCEAIVIETATPSGIENFFAEVGTPISGRNSERIPVSKESIANMIATAPKYGVTMLVSHNRENPSE